jgi:hypothetical protein
MVVNVCATTADPIIIIFPRIGLDTVRKYLTASSGCLCLVTGD